MVDDAQGFPVLNFQEAIDRLRARPRPYAGVYRAMYSSYLGGIVQDPALMAVPIDDHLVHRGDGVFEAMKLVARKIYALDRHLTRLERSAELAQLAIPGGVTAVRQACLATARASGLEDGLLRVYVSRGPGGFSANPYESIGAQIYAVATDLAEPSKAKREAGVTCRASSIPAKPGWFATVKSCNYLQNALMKKEAVDAGVDFVLSRDDRGMIAEGSAENMAIVSPTGELITPRFERVLRGVTAVRAMELARGMPIFAGAREGDLSFDDAYRAREVLLFGTTIDVLPVTMFDGRAIGDGKPGPAYRALYGALLQDQLTTALGVTTDF